jgi:hypothetical protein
MGLLKKDKDKEEKPKEYVKEVENINTFTDPKTAETRNEIMKDFIKKVVIKRNVQD